MKGNYTIHTSRLVLRLLELTNLEDLWPYVSDTELPKYMSWNAHQDRAETRMFLERISLEKQQGKSLSWGVFHQNRLTGLISLIAITRNHRSLTYDRAELAYWLGSEFRGQGFMDEAGRDVIKFAFNQLGFHRLIVSHVSENISSERSIKRWGFQYIGEERETFKKNDHWYNHKLYELLERDWRNHLQIIER